MGIAVRNSAYSPNIKERLDHSCALFDRDGRLIAQAEHIPVHLGSLPWGLTAHARRSSSANTAALRGRDVGRQRSVRHRHASQRRHRVRPIFDRGQLVGLRREQGASRRRRRRGAGLDAGRCADLFAEGLVVPPMRLMRDDRVVDETVALFRANSRTPEARSGDLRAQIAGNFTGERRLLELCERYGVASVRRGDRARTRRQRAAHARGACARSATASSTRPIIWKIATASRASSSRCAWSCATAARCSTTPGRRAQLEAPLNAVFGVTLSGVHYALRAVTDPTHPDERRLLSAGRGRACPRARCSTRAARRRSPAETSRRACATPTSCCRRWRCAAPERVPACSGGTMSNVMLGGTRPDGATWAFYETNGCGMGARPERATASTRIQCHMTNTLNTPIEAIEREFPLRVTRYEFAEGTGGAGRHRGGNGLIRSIELAEGTAHATLLADRHTLRPPGAHGGEAGRLRPPYTEARRRPKRASPQRRACRSNPETF